MINRLKRQLGEAKQGLLAFTAAALVAATSFVAYHEGYVPSTYYDPVGIPTICFGHTGPEVQMGQTATEAECKALLAKDLEASIAAVTRCIKTPLTKNRAVALTSFVYNVGSDAFCKSTLVRLANQGRWEQACAELSKWVYAKNRKLPGLVKRRAEERALCEKPDEPVIPFERKSGDRIGIVPRMGRYSSSPAGRAERIRRAAGVGMEGRARKAA